MPSNLKAPKIRSSRCRWRARLTSARCGFDCAAGAEPACGASGKRTRHVTAAVFSDVHLSPNTFHCGGMDDILKTIPHRPPFLFIDEIVELREDGVTCQRTIRADEPQFEGHYPGNPIMPGVLLCEACFQAGAIYLAKQIEQEGRSLKDVTPVLSRIGEAKFKQMVRPGDVITIEVTMKETVSKFYFMKGKVLKGAKPALTIEFALAMIEE